MNRFIFFKSPEYVSLLSEAREAREARALRHAREDRNAREDRKKSVDELHYRHPENTEFVNILLCFSYLYYEKDLDIEYTFEENIECKYKEFKKLIKEHPELVFIKNNFGLYPLELVDLLTKTFIDSYNTYYNYIRYDDRYDNIFNSSTISLSYLHKIKNDLRQEYIKYELVKKVAVRYIKNSNHIGTDASLLQLPLHIWEYIFTFI